MKISTKGRYALRMLIDLAQHAEEGLVSLKAIAARQDISQKYLEQIVTYMSRAGYLKGVRGSQGGYRLTRDPRDINVGEILETIEGCLSPVACLEPGKEGCDRCGDCSTLDLWKGLYETIMNYLNGITLQDLLDRAEESGSATLIV